MSKKIYIFTLAFFLLNSMGSGFCICIGCCDNSLLGEKQDSKTTILKSCHNNTDDNKNSKIKIKCECQSISEKKDFLSNNLSSGSFVKPEWKKVSNIIPSHDMELTLKTLTFNSLIVSKFFRKNNINTPYYITHLQLII